MRKETNIMEETEENFQNDSQSREIRELLFQEARAGCNKNG